MRSLRQPLEERPATREAAEEVGDDRPAGFCLTDGGHAVVFPRMAPRQTARAGRARCAFARGAVGAASEVSGQPGVHGGEGDFGEGYVDGEGRGGYADEVAQERT